MGDSFDIDEFLEGWEPRVAEARVLRPRPDLRAKHTDLEALLRKAVTDDKVLNREPEAPGIAEQIRALEAEIEAAEVHVFRFRSLGTRGWSDLLAEHPPTAEQRRENPRADYNPLTFPVAAVAACSDSPKLTKAHARALEAQLDLTEWNKLWAAVLEANIGGDGSPKSVLAGTTLRTSEPSATTAASGESPDPSSSDE